MKINLSNYEAWLLDYHDGTLSDQQKDELILFLNDHPELMSVLNDYEDVTLIPNNLSFNKKEMLYHNPGESMGLAWSDFLLAKKLEEGLDEDENLHLERIMAQNPQLVHDAHLMLQTRLKDHQVTYQHKSRLKRFAPLSMLTLTRARQVAAIIVVLLLSTTVWLNMPGTTDANVPVVAEKKVVDEMSADEVFYVAGNKYVVIESVVTEKLVSTQKNFSTAQAVIFKPVQTIDEVSHHPAPAVQEPMMAMASLSAHVDYANSTPAPREMTLNAMMPIYAALKTHIDQEKPTVVEKEIPRALALLEGGIKVLNAMSGNDIKLYKEFDENGNLTAYSVQTSSAIISKEVARR